jgi:hypothetical protein
VTPILSAEALAEGAFCLGRIVVDYLDSHQTGRQSRIWERAVNQIGFIVKRQGLCAHFNLYRVRVFEVLNPRTVPNAAPFSVWLPSESDPPEGFDNA